MMRTPIIAMALALAASVANAAPVNLTCEGTTTYLPNEKDYHLPNEKDHVIKDMMTLELDLSARTATVGGEAPVPISRVNEQEVSFAPEHSSKPLKGVLGGLLNRTGDVHIAFGGPPGKAYVFVGVCKPGGLLKWLRIHEE